MARVEAEVTLLSTAEGGRSAALHLGHSEPYRPHLVVGEIGQRRAIVGSDRVIREEYLGVQFRRAESELFPGSSARVWMDLIYYPGITYERLQPGSKFTIREGPNIVGYGKVLQRNEEESR